MAADSILNAELDSGHHHILHTKLSLLTNQFLEELAILSLCEVDRMIKRIFFETVIFVEDRFPRVGGLHQVYECLASWLVPDFCSRMAAPVCPDLCIGFSIAIRVDRLLLRSQPVSPKHIDSIAKGSNESLSQSISVLFCPSRSALPGKLPLVNRR
jgi:hypothetical protein